MLRPREQQRTGHFWEPHVQHKHKGRRGESRPLWPQSQHHLHHGLMSECEGKRGRVEHTKVTSHGFFPRVHAGVFCMSPFLTTHNKDTVVQKHKAHFQQHFNGIRGRIPVITARWSSHIFLRFCEEKCSSHSVSVSLWIKEPRAYR